MDVTYSKYLKIDELLSMQEPLSEGPEHDEMLFILIHQVYELWFKQILHETKFLQTHLENGDTHTSLRTLKRILTILKTLVSQVDILETMTPMNFNSFRARLDTSSGFQSAQFRELEFALGQKDTSKLKHLDKDTRNKILSNMDVPTVYDSFMMYLSKKGFELPQNVLKRNFSQPIQPNEDIQKVLVKVYKEDKTTGLICERLIDLDEGLQEWRYRHVKMVERTIGMKIGTGGMGAEYLRKTLFTAAFPDLWAIRIHL